MGRNQKTQRTNSPRISTIWERIKRRKYQANCPECGKDFNQSQKKSMRNFIKRHLKKDHKKNNNKAELMMLGVDEHIEENYIPDLKIKELASSTLYFTIQDTAPYWRTKGIQTQEILDNPGEYLEILGLQSKNKATTASIPSLIPTAPVVSAAIPISTSKISDANMSNPSTEFSDLLSVPPSLPGSPEHTLLDPETDAVLLAILNREIQTIVPEVWNEKSFSNES